MLIKTSQRRDRSWGGNQEDSPQQEGMIRVADLQDRWLLDSNLML